MKFCEMYISACTRSNLLSCKFETANLPNNKIVSEIGLETPEKIMYMSVRLQWKEIMNWVKTFGLMV